MIWGGGMKLSTKGRYGLRALIDLALYSETEAIPISSVASRQGISESYLEQLFAKLRKSGLITSARGAQGGYRLARQPMPPPLSYCAPLPYWPTTTAVIHECAQKPKCSRWQASVIARAKLLEGQYMSNSSLMRHATNCFELKL